MCPILLGCRHLKLPDAEGVTWLLAARARVPGLRASFSWSDFLFLWLRIQRRHRSCLNTIASRFCETMTAVRSLVLATRRCRTTGPATPFTVSNRDNRIRPAARAGRCQRFLSSAPRWPVIRRPVGDFRPRAVATLKTYRTNIRRPGLASAEAV